MARRGSEGVVSPAELAVRLHDAAAGLGVGIAVLKPDPGAAQAVQTRRLEQAQAILAEVLADLTQLSRAVSQSIPRRAVPADLRMSLKRDAERLGIFLELQVIGKEDWLPDNQFDLVRLAGREAIHNVKRHSGAGSCRITVDFSTCPFVVTMRDSGVGINPGPQEGDGIRLVGELARSMGGTLSIVSEPGQGAELVLTGPRCILNSRDPIPGEHPDRGLRSVVADQSPSSRRRVANRRPLGGSRQQIT